MSRQFDHLQESTLSRLREKIPASCPIIVHRLDEGGFRAATLDERDRIEGRFQVVAAWVDGFVCAWLRLRRQSL